MPPLASPQQQHPVLKPARAVVVIASKRARARRLSTRSQKRRRRRRLCRRRHHHHFECVWEPYRVYVCACAYVCCRVCVNAYGARVCVYTFGSESQSV